MTFTDRLDALRLAEGPALRDALREKVAAEVSLALIEGGIDALDDEGGAEAAGREEA